MKVKTIVTVVLLVFVAVSLGWLIFKTGPSKKTEAAANPYATGATAPSIPKAGIGPQPRMKIGSVMMFWTAEIICTVLESIGFPSALTRLARTTASLLTTG